jgi:cellobiose transport system substrate-binding protein
MNTSQAEVPIHVRRSATSAVRARLSPRAQVSIGDCEDGWCEVRVRRMRGWIQQNAPATRGQWDVATVPGGAGNWGGSWLTVPKQSAHPAEAYALASWLTEPEQQLRVFRETGNMPSLPELYDDPAVTGFRNPFFRNAPVGQIFSSAAKRAPTQYLGVHNAAVRTIMEDHLGRVEIGELTADQAWQQAVTAARAVR